VNYFLGVIPIPNKNYLILFGSGMRGMNAATKCEAFREARRDRAPAVADKSKLQDAILI
jgi:hypothetical protein